MNRRDFMIRLGLAVPAVKTVVCFGTGIWRPDKVWYPEMMTENLSGIASNWDKWRAIRWLNRKTPDLSRVETDDLERLLRDLHVKAAQARKESPYLTACHALKIRIP